MYFGICDGHRIKYANPKGGKAILIRCLSQSEYTRSPLATQDIVKYSNILKLNLQDKNFLSLENIKLLNEFIINNDFDEVIAHCALGISRSPAIMICVAKILQCEPIETMIKEKYNLYNKSIVQMFESFPYQEKVINDSEVIFRNLYKTNDEEKILIKK